jgi:alpha-ketoglutarate-dependent 2,4-dichlorophenoxyacetate dioxygenase
MQISPVTSDFVATVAGIDVRSRLSVPTIAALEEALSRYLVLVLPNQPLSSEEQVAFSEQFGPLQKTLAAIRGERGKNDSALSDISNLPSAIDHAAADTRTRRLQRANLFWHSDDAFRVPSSRYTLLFGLEVPDAGGTTQFADLRAAYDALPAQEQETLRRRHATHSLAWGRIRAGTPEFEDSDRRAFPPVSRPLVRKHPMSHRLCVFVGNYTERISGMSDRESELVLERLMRHVTQPRYVHEHRWQRGDLVMWDNRSLVHRGTSFDEARYRRHLRRTSVSDVADTEA